MLRRLFYATQAMELEHAFFAAQSQGTAEDDRPHHLTQGDVSSGSVQISSGGSVTFQPGEKNGKGRGVFSGVQHRVALLCVDFDDTLTDGDTTSLLVKTAKGQVSCKMEDHRLHTDFGLGPLVHFVSCLYTVCMGRDV